MTEMLQIAPVQPPLILLQFWAQKSPPPLRKRAFLHTENVDPAGQKPNTLNPDLVK